MNNIKKFELDIDKVNHSKYYYQFDILPSLMFIKDSQMAKYYKNINENPIVAYSILFQWLGFYINLTYNKYTREGIN